MKKITVFFLLIAGTVFGQNEEIKLTKFTSLEATGNCKVTVKEGTEYKAVIVNQDAEMSDDKISVNVAGSTCMVKLGGNNIKEKQVEVILYTDKLISVTAKKGCWLIIEPLLSGDKVTLSSAMGGKIKADVKCEALVCDINNGGSISVSGTAETAEYTVSKGGTIGGSFLEAKSIVAKVTAGGDVICNASESLDMKITAGGNISYKGEPKELNQKISAGGEITKLK